jgi:hypothetical protein
MEGAWLFEAHLERAIVDHQQSIHWCFNRVRLDHSKWLVGIRLS